MKKTSKTSLAFAVTGLISGLSSVNVQAAESVENPFSLSELSSGYMQLAAADTKTDATDKAKTGSCGEGKCGANMMPKATEKNVEAKCAGAKTTTPPATDNKMKEGQCGEGKCGANMKPKEGDSK